MNEDHRDNRETEQRKSGEHDSKRCTTGQGFSEMQIIDSTDLFATKNEIQINHAGEIYRLRVTKNGKLILTK